MKTLKQKERGLFVRMVRVERREQQQPTLTRPSLDSDVFWALYVCLPLQVCACPWRRRYPCPDQPKYQQLSDTFMTCPSSPSCVSLSKHPMGLLQNTHHSLPSHLWGVKFLPVNYFSACSEVYKCHKSRDRLCCVHCHSHGAQQSPWHNSEEEVAIVMIITVIAIIY